MSWLSIQSAHLEVILRVAKKVVLQPENKIKFAEPLFSNLKKKSEFQNHFTVILKITSKGED